MNYRAILIACLATGASCCYERRIHSWGQVKSLLSTGTH